MNVPTHLSLEMWLELRGGYALGHQLMRPLKEVVFDKNLLRDIQQLTLNCHTGSLEVYHSVQTKYLPKRQHFSYKGMIARTQLAVLDHNANTGRQQATSTKGDTEGDLRYKVVYPKRSKGMGCKTSHGEENTRSPSSDVGCNH